MRLALLLACLAAPALAEAPQWDGPLTRVHVRWGGDLIVLQDPGGAVHERMLEVGILIAQEQPLRIVGSCASACTMYLGMPTACVEPGALLMFHGPGLMLGQIPPDDFEDVSKVLASYYPPALAKWFMEEGRWADSWLDGRAVIAMGARACHA